MVTFGQIERQVHNLLGNILGATVALMETNYAAISSNTNRNNPDFSFTPVQDAIVATMTELATVICDTPQHPERKDFLSASGPLADGAPLPNTDAGGIPIIGGLGAVLDSTSLAALKPASLDIITDYNLHKAGIYAGCNFYWYAINGNRVFHTRTNVVFEVQVYQRPTFAFAGSIAPISDHHEKAIVNGAVSFIAQKEGNYSGMAKSCLDYYSTWIAEIRTLAKFPVAQIDPSET